MTCTEPTRTVPSTRRRERVTLLRELAAEDGLVPAVRCLPTPAVAELRSTSAGRWYSTAIHVDSRARRAINAAPNPCGAGAVPRQPLLLVAGPEQDDIRLDELASAALASIERRITAGEDRTGQSSTLEVHVGIQRRSL